jgi:hypothetical protein
MYLCPVHALQLKDVTSGKTVSISDFKGSPTLVMFLCVHCPYVVLLKGRLGSILQPTHLTPTVALHAGLDLTLSHVTSSAT